MGDAVGISRQERLVRAAGDARELARVVGAARRAYGASVAATAARARRLRSRGGFAFEEALRTGLLDPALPDHVAERYVSRRTVARLVARLNPAELATLTEERAMFLRVAAAAGLPTPRLLGIVGRAGGWSAAGRPLPLGPDGAAELLATGASEEFLVAPSSGRGDAGVRVLRREGRLLVDAAGARTTPAQLATALVEDPRWSLHVVTERPRAHPGVSRLLPPGATAIVRIVSHVADDGEVRMVHAGLRIAPARRSADDGREPPGALLAEVDVATGEIGPTLVPGPAGLGLVTADGHAAGRPAAHLPEWEAVHDLVRHAARELMPRRAIRWDVAICDRGPLLVDATRSYDPWPSPGFGEAWRALERAEVRGAAAPTRLRGPAEPVPATR